MTRDKSNECGLVIVKASDVRSNEALRRRQVTHEKRLNTVTIRIGRPYQVNLDRIPDHIALMWWCAHLCEKTWMEPMVLREFILRVCKAKGWDPH